MQWDNDFQEWVNDFQVWDEELAIWLDTLMEGVTMTTFLKMPVPAGWAEPEAHPVAVNVAKTKGGLFIAMQATGTTLGKSPAAKATDNKVGTHFLPMPKVNYDNHNQKQKGFTQ